MLDHERKAQKDGFDFIIGIDEAGRGPLAGPVVAAAVHICDFNFQCRIDDSKKLSNRQREEAALEIMTNCDFGVGVIDETLIDRHNILQAAFMAMKAAVLDLTLPQSLHEHKVCLLVDGNRFKCDLPYAHRTIVKGDAQSLSIACASILAKVTRDRLLMAFDKIFPEYGFAKHKGYGTKIHKQAIRKYGLSPIHRKTFSYASVYQNDSDNG